MTSILDVMTPLQHVMVSLRNVMASLHVNVRTILFLHATTALLDVGHFESTYMYINGGNNAGM